MMRFWAIALSLSFGWPVLSPLGAQEPANETAAPKGAPSSEARSVDLSPERAATPVEQPSAVPAAPAVEKCPECAPCPGAVGGASLAGCAAPLKEVVAAYARAHEDIGHWAEAKSRAGQKILEKEDGLKKKIQENSTEVNELKFKSGKADKKRLKELESENKGLWKQLDGIAREKKDFCRSLSKEAPAQVRELNKGVELKLKEALLQVVE